MRIELPAELAMDPHSAHEDAHTLTLPSQWAVLEPEQAAQPEPLLPPMRLSVGCAPQPTITLTF